MQTRRLLLDSRTSDALHDWLEVRRVEKTDLNDRLLVGCANSWALSPKGRYNICQTHMRLCFKDMEIAQMGTDTLHNTCISLCFSQGVELCEILRRRGLKDAGMLIRLQNHVHSTAVR